MRDKKPTLKIISGDRSALEQEVVRLAWFGSNAELEAGIARLERRGSVRLVADSQAPAAINDATASDEI